MQDFLLRICGKSVAPKKKVDREKVELERGCTHIDSSNFIQFFALFLDQQKNFIEILGQNFRVTLTQNFQELKVDDMDCTNGEHNKFEDQFFFLFLNMKQYSKA